MRLSGDISAMPPKINHRANPNPSKHALDTSALNSITKLARVDEGARVTFDPHRRGFDARHEEVEKFVRRQQGGGDEAARGLPESLPAPRKYSAQWKVSDLDWTEKGLDVAAALLKSQKPKQPSVETRKTIISQVFIWYQRWLAWSRSYRRVVPLEEARPDWQEENFPAEEPSLGQVCDLVARRNEISRPHLKSWVAEQFATGDLEVTRRKQAEIILEDPRRHVSPGMLLEVMSYMKERKKLALPVDAVVLQLHLNSPVRVHPLLNAINCPPVVVSRYAITNLLKRLEATVWAPFKMIGRPSIGATLAIVKAKLYRHYCIIIQYYWSKEAERKGLVIVAIQDETYIHERHHANEQLCMVDDSAVMESATYDATLEGPGRDGRRICIMGTFTRLGAMICRNPDGSLVRDCAWFNSRLEKVRSGGTFMELDAEGRPRKQFLPKLKKAAKDIHKCTFAEIKALAEIEVPRIATTVARVGCLGFKNRSIKDIATEILAQREQQAMEEVPETVSCEPAKDRGVNLPLGVGLKVDFEAYDRELTANSAPTTDMIMVAYEEKGDYHRNFDMVSFYKHMVRIRNTYPLWCEQMEARRGRGEIFYTSEFPFFANGQPTRALHVYIDNAPYHLAVILNIMAATKDRLAAILRELGTTTISFKVQTKATGEVATATAEVPKEGVAWQRGFPTTDQLRLAVVEVIKKQDPHLLQAPWQRLLDGVKDEWGPADSPGWLVFRWCPYMSEEVVVELRWSFTKGYCGAPSQCFEGRTLSHIVDLWHEYTAGDVIMNPDRAFLHCERNMDEWIEANRGSLPGNVTGSVADNTLTGLPTAEVFREWQKVAGTFEEEEVYTDSDDD